MRQWLKFQLGAGALAGITSFVVPFVPFQLGIAGAMVTMFTTGYLFGRAWELRRLEDGKIQQAAPEVYARIQPKRKGR